MKTFMHLLGIGSSICLQKSIRVTFNALAKWFVL